MWELHHVPHVYWDLVHLKWLSSLQLVETVTNKSDNQSRILLRMQFHFYNPAIQPLLCVFFAVGKDKESFKNEITWSKMTFFLFSTSGKAMDRIWYKVGTTGKIRWLIVAHVCGFMLLLCALQVWYCFCRLKSTYASEAFSVHHTFPTSPLLKRDQVNPCNPPWHLARKCHSPLGPPFPCCAIDIK